jgi:hypothetical protein
MMSKYAFTVCCIAKYNWPIYIYHANLKNTAYTMVYIHILCIAYTAIIIISIDC